MSGHQVCICFKTKEEHEEAAKKSHERRRSLSAQVRHYFQKLPHIKPTDERNT